MRRCSARMDIGGSNIRAGLVELNLKKDRGLRAAREKLKLAPFVGVGCPGLIAADGGITRGGQNLPGNWEHRDFSSPAALREALPRVGGEDTVIVMHNDAVVQGLSEAPFCNDVAHWGVLTIGTGLGNARFSDDVAEQGRTG